MKRFMMCCFGLLLCLLILAEPNAASADMIWEPDDDFYSSHHTDCEYEYRSYIANGKHGNVTAYVSPVSHKKTGTYENGTTFFITYIYTDKKDHEWGYIQVDEKTGWINMKQLVLMYDNISFTADHENEFQEYKGEFDDFEIEENTIIIWSYPCSGFITNKLVNVKKMPTIKYTYTDKDGRLWGYEPYSHSLDGWVCINDPTNENIPSIGVTPSVTMIPPSSNTSAKWNDNTTVILLIGLVAVLTFATAVIIRLLWRKKAVQSDGDQQ